MSGKGSLQTNTQDEGPAAACNQDLWGFASGCCGKDAESHSDSQTTSTCSSTSRALRRSVGRCVPL